MTRGQVRRSQVITTYGPGALIDLPKDSAIVGGLDGWPKVSSLEEIDEPRLSGKLQGLTQVQNPRLYAPPANESRPGKQAPGIRVWRFPEWFVVVEEGGGEERELSRRLVHRKHLDNRGRFEDKKVVATRFVRACVRGHVDDLDWRWFVHRGSSECPATQPLWLDERGASGDLGDLFVRCGCGVSRGLVDASVREMRALGLCPGKRPWLGSPTPEACTNECRLLIRTASNAYFPQVVSVLSLPHRGSAVEELISRHWDDLAIVDDVGDLKLIKKKPRIAADLASFSDEEILAAVLERKGGSKTSQRAVKQVELEALLAAQEGFGDDVPVDPDFHARRLPERIWRQGKNSGGIEAVIQLHRLREVLALVGFTRFEAMTPDIHGEYDSDVQRADLALDPSWFPAVENRGEGIFLQFQSEALKKWTKRPPVQERLTHLMLGHELWMEDRKSKRPFPGGPYILMHTLSHLLIQSLSMRCGYPASSIRERIYLGEDSGQSGILLYTGSPDAEGTLGGLVQQARHIEDHLAQALQMGALCSNDPICAQHEPGKSMEGRWLHGASCHGCALVAETSCEMRNDYLDRALVVPTLGVEGAAFFPAVG